jgi:hypothetical protein
VINYINFLNMKMRQNTANVKNAEKMRRGGQKCGKCRINAAIGTPWKREERKHSQGEE